MPTQRSPYRARRKPPWASYSDQELLDLRLCDLKLRTQDTVFPHRLERIHRELADRGLRFRPHIWFSHDWLSPDGIPGFAVPFYLGHPRLMKLEDRQVFEVEGGSDPWCVQLMRHETGHAIDSAFRLHRRKLWRKTFGSFSRPYPDFYRARPMSRSYVHHLDAWYAQSHPAEDFAETFAVWLRPGNRWRRRYAGWPALRKLECVNTLMEDIAGKPAPVRDRSRMAPLSGLTMTLRQYYEAKRKRYMTAHPTIADPDLRRLFSTAGGRRKASAFLRRARARLRQVVARGTGEHPYAVDQILSEMIKRCRELNLVVDRPEEIARLEAAVLLSVRTTSYLHKSGRLWIRR